MICLQREKISNKIYIVTFILLLLVLPTAFIHEKISRIIYYWCGYLSIIGLLINPLTIKKEVMYGKNISLAFLSISCLFFGWSLLSEFAASDKISKLLYVPGKRWLIATIISTYILDRRCEFKKFPKKRLILAAMSLTFNIATTYGIIQKLHSDARIILGINRATLAAYAYSSFTLAFLSILALVTFKKHKYIIQLIIILISTYIIFLTQTRAAMLFHPVLSLLLLISLMRRDNILIHLRIKWLIMFFSSLFVVTAVNYQIIIKRYNSTIQEIREYNNGNDYTSLGTRFSMWKLGIISFIEAPFGQSEFNRNNRIITYLNNANKKSGIMAFLNIHLHNEFIQYSSIFGIVGVLVLLSFFYILIFRVTQPSFIKPVSLTTISILSYGITDVLLTSVEIIVIFSTIIILSSIICDYRK